MSTEKLILPPPFEKVEVPLEESDPQIPGEIVIDRYGKLLKRSIQYSGVLGYLTDSYNYFLDVDVPRIISGTVIKVPGGIITFSKDFTPILPNYDTGKPLYPDIARQLSLTYAMNYHTDMLFIPDGESADSDKVQKVKIEAGYYPIALGSTHDRARTVKPEDLESIGECRYDPPGYFIIDGAEHAILIQEILRTNKILITSKKKGKVTANMTCETTQGSKIITLSAGRKKRKIKLVLSGFKKNDKGKTNNIGVMNVFRMLGVKTQAEIMKLLSFFVASNNLNKVLVALAPSFADFRETSNDFEVLGLQMLASQNAADARISKRRKKTLVKKNVFNLNTPDGRQAAIMDVMHSELFPFLNDEEDPVGMKINLLAMMTVEYAEYMAGLRDLDDRDSWSNKRLRPCGSVMLQLFRIVWMQIVQDLETRLSESKSPTLENAAKWINTGMIRDVFVNSFTSGNWGVKGKVKKNVTQHLKRDTLIQAISHLGQISVNTSGNDKYPTIRMVQNTQYGFIDPIETPEGKNVGIIKAISVTAQITTTDDEFFLRKNLKEYYRQKPDIDYNIKYIVNGKFIGWCSDVLIRKAKEFKIKGLIPKFTSIAYNRRNSIVYLYCDSCRLVRPLLVINPKTSRAVIDEKNLWSAEFNDLIREGCIEYVDPWEQEYVYISESYDNLKSVVEQARQAADLIKDQGISPNDPAVIKKMMKARYTHCEIDPSALLGYASSMIPFPDKNQAPRNVFQCSMSKQAQSIYHSNYLNRFDGTIKTLAFPTRPIFEPQMSTIIGADKLMAGEMVYVAFLSYTGYTPEDAFVFNKASLERGTFYMVKWSNYKTTVSVTDVFSEKLERPQFDPKQAKRYSAINEQGLPIKGRYVREGYCVIGKTRKIYSTGVIANVSEFVNIGEEGFIDDYRIDRNTATGETFIKVKLRDVRITIEGDKFAPRYAQKGTVGIVLPEEDMPFNGDPREAPTIDVIVDAHCVTGDTKVSLGHGVTRKIKDLSSEGGEAVMSYNINGFIEPHTQFGLEPKGEKKILKLTLEDGRILKCTPDHKIMTVTQKDNCNVYGWLEAQNLISMSDSDKPSRLIIGPEFPYDEVCELEKDWELDTGEYLFTMKTKIERERSLAFARLLGLIVTDGCVSFDKRRESHRSNVCLGSMFDVEMCMNDILILCGKRPAFQYDEESFTICLPATIARAAANIPGVMIGRRTRQPSTNPEFLMSDKCPKSIIREFLGGMFGGDGSSPCVTRTTEKNRKAKEGSGDRFFIKEVDMTKHTTEEFLVSLITKMEQVIKLLKVVGIAQVSIRNPRKIKNSGVIKAFDADTNPLFAVKISIKSGLDFTEKIGFRYCMNKTMRLSAAASYWRYIFNVKRQHKIIVDKTEVIYNQNDRTRLDLSLIEAKRELCNSEAILNEYYTALTKDQVYKFIQSGNMLSRLDYRKIYDPETYFKIIGCYNWFNWKGNKKGSKNHVYIVDRIKLEIPKFQLRLLDSRPCGIETVYDISVNKNRSFLAESVVISNCISSRICIEVLVEYKHKINTCAKVLQVRNVAGNTIKFKGNLV